LTPTVVDADEVLLLVFVSGVDEPTVAVLVMTVPFGVAGAIAVVWLVITFFLSVHTVGQREVGIVYSFSGTITGKKDPGVVLTTPWQHIKKENVGIQSEEFDLDPNNAAVSQDQQPIYARVFVNFQVLPDDVVGLYKRVGPNWKHILLDARVLQDVKEVTATYETPEITTHREDLRKQIRERLEQELGRYDVKIVDVFLKNIGFSVAYTQAVEQKQVQVQQALQAEAKVAQSKAEAQQRVAQARGEANAIYLKGRALRNNPEILRLEAIDKLNPNAQVVICTGTSCPAFLPSGAFARTP
jgi:regulator of protease activity HflC (stomatin/prohibitin superfamily)